MRVTASLRSSFNVFMSGNSIVLEIHSGSRNVQCKRDKMVVVTQNAVRITYQSVKLNLSTTHCGVYTLLSYEDFRE